MKYIDIKEFREQGYLQELNRKFLHPLGLALEISIDEDGNETLGGIWDYREDEEGIYYHSSVVSSDKFAENITNIQNEFVLRSAKRLASLGYIEQKATKSIDKHNK